MSEDKNTIYSSNPCKDKSTVHHNSVNGTIYGMAFIGSLIYFLQHSDSFWTVLTAIFKAIFWPAFLVYKLLEFLKMP